jgi:hypothetical protein
MTFLVSAVGLAALLAALAGAVLLDLAREAGPAPGSGRFTRLLGATATDRRAVTFLVAAAGGLGAVCTVVRLLGAS